MAGTSQMDDCPLDVTPRALNYFSDLVLDKAVVVNNMYFYKYFPYLLKVCNLYFGVLNRNYNTIYVKQKELYIYML
jgi:hypothetical protein